MGGGCATASTDKREAKLFHKLFVGGGKLFGTEWVAGAVSGELRKTGVRHHHDGNGRVLGELTQVLAHLGWAGCTVQADHVDTQRLEGGQRCANLGTHQHGSGGLNGYLDKDGELDALFFDGLLAPIYC